MLNDDLKHYGIPGMKWGIRRFQNPDGSLTKAGKKKYGSYTEEEAKESDAIYDKIQKSKEYQEEYKRQVEIARKHADEWGITEGTDHFDETVGYAMDDWMSNHHLMIEFEQRRQERIKRDIISDYGKKRINKLKPFITNKGKNIVAQHSKDPANVTVEKFSTKGAMFLFGVLGITAAGVYNKLKK